MAYKTSKLKYAFHEAYPAYQGLTRNNDAGISIALSFNGNFNSFEALGFALQAVPNNIAFAVVRFSHLLVFADTPLVPRMSKIFLLKQIGYLSLAIFCVCAHSRTDCQG